MSQHLVVFHVDMNFVSLREDYLRIWLKQISEMGYNAILWELEDKVQWETCPDVVWPEAMSKDQFRSVLAYAHGLGLEAIPLLQTVGHGEYVMKHQAYHRLREDSNYSDCYCTSNPQVRAFLSAMVQEYLELFGSIRYFHLGGDEAYRFATCPTCQARLASCSRNELYAEHVMGIAKPIRDKGIRVGIWGDMVLQDAGDMDSLPRDVILWDWNYTDGVDTPQQVRVWGKGMLAPEDIDEATRARCPEMFDDQGRPRRFYTVDVLQRLGFDVILCSAARSGGDSVFCGRHEAHAFNIAGSAIKAREAKLLGHCVTSWAIRLFNYEIQQPWLSLAGLANTLPQASCQPLIDDCGRTLFGIDPADFYQAIEWIGSPYLLISSTLGSGTCWNGLKDGARPAKDHVSKMFEKWRRNPIEYDKWLAMFDQATQRIPQGIEMLKDFAVRASGGQGVIDAWLVAGDFQLRSSQCVWEVVAIEQGKPARDAQKIQQELEQLKIDYCKWSSNWMMPISSKTNSGLIYDNIIDYVASS